MPKYRLSVDETISKLNIIDIETNLNERELGLLLNKIEADVTTSALSLSKKLQAQNIKVNEISTSSKPYYTGVEVLELEEIEEPEHKELVVKYKSGELDISDIELAIESARQKMNSSIDLAGTQSDITIRISQDLDSLIVSYMGN